MENETWRFEQSLDSVPSGFSLSLERNEQEVLSDVDDVLGYRPFHRHQCQAFDQWLIISSYIEDEKIIFENVKVVPRSAVSKSANIICSHVIYRIKSDDKNLFKFRARIAPHGNEDSEKDNLHIDCCLCPQIGIPFFLCVTASKMKWRVVRFDNQSAFLKTGKPSRDVSVRPPAECSQRHFVLCLLDVAAYGLLNANDKWQNLSDDALTSLGLEHVDLIPQLFIIKKNEYVVLVAIEIVDYMLLTGTETH